MRTKTNVRKRLSGAGFGALLAALCLLGAGCTKEAREEYGLPKGVEAFCLEWFPDERIVGSEPCDGGVRVSLCRGTEAVFDALGTTWLRVANMKRGVPRGLVAGPVEEYLDAYYPDDKALLLERCDGFRVGLDAKVLLTFDADYGVTVTPWEIVDVIPEF